MVTNLGTAALLEQSSQLNDIARDHGEGVANAALALSLNEITGKTFELSDAQKIRLAIDTMTTHDLNLHQAAAAVVSAKQITDNMFSANTAKQDNS